VEEGSLVGSAEVLDAVEKEGVHVCSRGAALVAVHGAVGREEAAGNAERGDALVHALPHEASGLWIRKEGLHTMDAMFHVPNVWSLNSQERDGVNVRDCSERDWTV